MSPISTRWNFEHTYASLPKVFFSHVNPTPVSKPEKVVFNAALAEAIGIDFSRDPEKDWVEIFSGNAVPEGARPLAQAYAGHQFGHFTMLGDGRAILLGEQITPREERVDIQLKGPGPTPYSRRGDGRAALGPMLREYLISEAMFALGIPTTRSLAVVTTGEPVYRETPLLGAVLTRVAASHLRVGTFEYAAALDHLPDLQALAEHAIFRHDPDLPEGPDRYAMFFERVMNRQVKLVAKWMGVGFIHGVMNTDNMALSGETIDYGPCAFIDTYDPATVFSSIDRHGRYAYGQQPKIAQWNLARFAEALLPLMADSREKAIEIARALIDTFEDKFRHEWLQEMASKIGLSNPQEGDASLLTDLLSWMEKEQADYTNTFRRLSNSKHRETFMAQQSFADWFRRWETRLHQQGDTPQSVEARMDSRNPLYIPRNFHVEDALKKASERRDFDAWNALQKVVQHPYVEREEWAFYATPGPKPNSPYRTFCGT